MLNISVLFRIYQSLSAVQYPHRKLTSTSAHGTADSVTQGLVEKDGGDLNIKMYRSVRRDRQPFISRPKAKFTNEKPLV